MDENLYQYEKYETNILKISLLVQVKSMVRVTKRQTVLDLIFLTQTSQGNGKLFPFPNDACISKIGS